MSRISQFARLMALCFAVTRAFGTEAQSDPLAAISALAAQGGEINVGATALAIDHALNPAVDPKVYAQRLDSMAQELRRILAAAPDDAIRLQLMADTIYGRWGYASAAGVPADIYISFADALDQKQWNCFGMTMLYLALGERVGLPLQMVSGRGHVLVRLKDAPLFIETTQRGRVYDSLDYLATYLPYPCTDPMLYRAVGPRTAMAVSLTQTGAAFAAQGKAALALTCYRHAVEFDASYGEAYAAIGVLAANAGDHERSIREFQKAISLDPTLREAHAGLGAALYAKGDLQGAVRELRAALDLCETQPEPVFNLGQVLYEAGELEGAVAAFQTYTKLVPSDPDGFSRLAFPLEDLGKLDEALAAYREAIRLKPEHVDAMINGGGVLEKMGNLDLAQEWYEKAIAISPDAPLAHAGMGRVLTSKNDFDAAAQSFGKALTIDRENPAIWIDYARLDHKRGEIAAAIAKLEQALRIAPTEPETHIAFAEIYFEAGNTAKARDHAQAAQTFGGHLPESLRQLVRTDARPE